MCHNLYKWLVENIQDIEAIAGEDLSRGDVWVVGVSSGQRDISGLSCLPFCHMYFPALALPPKMLHSAYLWQPNFTEHLLLMKDLYNQDFRRPTQRWIAGRRSDKNASLPKTRFSMKVRRLSVRILPSGCHRYHFTLCFWWGWYGKV